MRLITSATVLGALMAMGASPASAARYDAYVAREKHRLATFAKWLRDGGAAKRGLVGEFGWPEHASARKPSGGLYSSSSRAHWGILGRYYFRRLRAHGLEATYWAAGERWHPSYNKLAFGGAPLNFSNPQGETIAQAAGPATVRGVNIGQHEFASSTSLPQPASWQYLAAHNVRFVRLPFRWELLQPIRRGALATDHVNALGASLDAAAAVGMKVVLDAHNYGIHQGRRMSGADLADLWMRMSSAFRGYPAVFGYDLMNEPNRDDMGYRSTEAGARQWQAMTQQAVTAVRSTGDTKRIYVMGFQHGAPEYFRDLHPQGPWISDPADNIYYEAHHYFDEGQDARRNPGSSRYDHEYSTYLARARAAGYKSFVD